MRDQVRVRLGETLGADEGRVRLRGAERRRVRGLDHEVVLRVDDRAFLLRGLTPEQEHDVARVRVDALNDRVREVLPALFLVRVGFTLAHREHSVEQQHALLAP